MSAAALRPIVTICGTTGVGKSKLAIELALHLNQSSNKTQWRRAKIINADSMQVYKGLDVITNKVPVSERHGIPHLLMDFKQPGEQYVVGEWVQDTLKLIDEMHNNGELPIIVGGTSYWIQHLIFPNRLVSKEVDGPGQQKEAVLSGDLQNAVLKLPPELFALFENLPPEPPSAKLDPDNAFKLHQLLSLLDPVISGRWHWKDTRKVLRNLEIIKESGKRPSEIIQEQSKVTTDSNPRFRTLCFWLYSEPVELGRRLDSRVDDMISQGLVEEVRSMRKLAENNSSSWDQTDRPILDYTLGIFQAIGYREFCGYLDQPTESSFKDAVIRMKLSTRQYAKRQISWIRNKLLPAIEPASTYVHMYLLDASALGDDWVANVQNPAIRLQNAFLSDRELPAPNTLSDTASNLLTVAPKDVNPTSVLEARRRKVCPVCTVQEDRPVMIEEGAEWEIHRNTKAHRKMASRASRNSNSDYRVKTNVENAQTT
ncbi:tRNA dimethylallyltransferase [Psilocybe cubensis]|uniref:tRNA dimethylallyltransferase n=2 Tax=Psilocybe cubensis TaxID=181762 RepID=A0ACB8H976_PSICU|nr:tRNA dimethylallyltransferase [Psilocybe cubensis]KAH9484197.1 tRNA dimethylallyltransferase [Psilocybe cubensis]